MAGVGFIRLYKQEAITILRKRQGCGVSVGVVVGVGRREQRAVWLTTFLSV